MDDEKAKKAEMCEAGPSGLAAAVDAVGDVLAAWVGFVLLGIVECGLEGLKLSWKETKHQTSIAPVVRDVVYLRHGTNSGIPG